MKKIAMLMALTSIVSVSACASDNANKGERGGRGGFHKTAQGGHKYHQDGVPRGLERLNLSDAQKQKIKAIIEANKPAQDAMRGERGNMRNTREEMLTSGTFDEAKARQIINERQQRYADMELKRMKTQHEIFQVLTPEQQKQWQEQRRSRAPQTPRAAN